MAIGRLSVGVGAKGKASSHAEYIAREGQYEKDPKVEKLEATDSGNMPAWAQADPNFFWKMSDAHERKNGTSYREHVISLPRELTPDQRHQLIKNWIAQEIGDKHAYQYAIHNPQAMDGQEQPHAHIMFSERLIDDIERDPDQYFKRHNPKNPDRGGAKKANLPQMAAERKADLVAQRDRWEQTCNKHLELAGSDARISMKSLKDQGIEREPINFTMIEINKPDIRETYKELLTAKSDFKQDKLDSEDINVVNELSAINEKYYEQADTAINRATNAINSTQRIVEDREKRIEWSSKKHQSINVRAERTTQRISGSERLTERADRAITSSQRAITDSQQLTERTDRAIDTKLAQQHSAAIKQRSAFDLLNIRMQSTVINRFSRQKDSKLSGDVPIGNIINHLMKAMNDGHSVNLGEGDNSHLANNRTAQSIKNFMLKNLSTQEVRFDYSNMSIDKFTDKYELKCDLNDLQKLNEINPPEVVIQPKIATQQHSDPQMKPVQRNDDYDLGM